MLILHDSLNLCLRYVLRSTLDRMSIYSDDKYLKRPNQWHERSADGYTAHGAVPKYPQVRLAAAIWYLVSGIWYPVSDI